MRGYCGSKSINAVIAEQKGIYPATRAAKKLGVSVEAVEAILSPVEWHHTGPKFDRTDYYDTAIDEETKAMLNAYQPVKTDE